MEKQHLNAQIQVSFPKHISIKVPKTRGAPQDFKMDKAGIFPWPYSWK